jgi:oligoribonuclease
VTKTEPKYLAWVDLETSGTNELTDDIIEFAFVLTDFNLRIIDSFSWVVNPERDGFEERIAANPVVFDMHTANGLLAAIAAGQGHSLHETDRTVEQVFKDHQMSPHEIMLAGSGVGHFDARFIRANMPRFSKYLAYPVIDVGVLRRFLRDLCGHPEIVPPAGDSGRKSHRAMDDVTMHITEAHRYMWVLRSLMEDGRLQELLEG